MIPVIEISPERQRDADAIYAVNAEAFGRDSESMLVDLLRNSDSFIPELSLVARMGDNIVGHILFTKVRIAGNDGSEYESLALAPMSVSPGYQHQGIGTALVNTGLERARQLGYKSVIVLGHESYYPRFGFTPASQWNIGAPFEVPELAFMAMELVPGGLEGVGGTVQYSKEFELV